MRRKIELCKSPFEYFLDLHYFESQARARPGPVAHSKCQAQARPGPGPGPVPTLVPVVQPAESAASEVYPAADVAPHRLVSFSYSEEAVGAEEERSGVGFDAGHE